MRALARTSTEAREQCVHVWALCHLDTDCQARGTLAVVLHLDLLASVQGCQEWLKMLAEFAIGGGGVWPMQPVVAAQEQFIATKLQTSGQCRVRYETLAGGQSTTPDGAQAVPDTVDVAEARLSLTSATIQESEPPICQVHSVVRVVANQDDPWPIRYVAVIRHIDEQFLQLVRGDPVVKDGDKLLQVDPRGVLDKKFQLVLH